MAAPHSQEPNGDTAAMPSAWSLVSLDQVCARSTGTRDPRKSPTQAFRYVDISSVDNRLKVITEARPILGKDAPSRARQVIQFNDVLVATTRPNLNAVAMVDKELDDEICSTGFCVLRPGHETDPEYLFAFVQSETFVRNLSDLVKGALYPAVTDGQVRAQKVPLPPLSEQRRIATRLREQLAEVAQARTCLQAQLDAIRHFSSAHLRSVFQTEAARTWSIKSLEKLISRPLRTGLSKPGGSESAHRCLTLTSVRNGILNLSASKPITVTEHEANANAVQPGLFYVVRGNGNISLVARGALAPSVNQEGVLFPDLLIEVSPNPSLLLPAFLRWVWDSPSIRRALETRSMTSAGIYKINLANLSTVEIPVPPLARQQCIIESCEAISERLRVMEESISGRLAALDRLPAALLREAFAGRL